MAALLASLMSLHLSSSSPHLLSTGSILLGISAHHRVTPVLDKQGLSRVGEWNERERKRGRVNLVTVRALAVPYWPMSQKYRKHFSLMRTSKHYVIID
jgi:hypothetical protein